MIRGAVAALAIVAASAANGETRPVSYTAQERAAILSHGPWPVSTKPDPSNRVSGDPAAIAFGKKLFFDARLSKFGRLSCASCHDPEKAFTDQLPKSMGVEQVDRNAPSLYNLRLKRWFGWDGTADSLWAQSLRPFLDAREFASSPELLEECLTGAVDLAEGYRDVFGHPPGVDSPETVMVNTAKALAAFQETLVTGPTPFDRFRDALSEGRAYPANDFPPAARRGLRIFVGKGRCSLCHSGPNFTNGEFHDIGLAHFAAPGRVDPGRHGGVVDVRTSPFNLLGAHNDDPAKSTAQPVKYLRQDHRNWGAFAVPSLRQIAETAPYMHDGSLATLEDVVRHYSELDEGRLHADGEQLLRPLKLNDAEIADMVAFLRALSASTGY